MTGYQAIYKCRLCGEIYNGEFAENKRTALITIGCACAGEQLCGTQGHSLCWRHICKNGDLGIGDFQGYKKINDEVSEWDMK